MLKHVPIPGSVGVRKLLRRVTSVDVVDGGLGKTFSSTPKYHQRSRPSYTGSDPLSRLPANPRGIYGETFPAAATGRRGHQLSLGLMQARFSREFNSAGVVAALFTVSARGRWTTPAQLPRFVSPSFPVPLSTLLLICHCQFWIPDS
ncbi:hypothetical protein K0M31_016699 [Melipona bicolor]|uniref:Uncharacterized protein n=1 Tax=Melipona bicolor TaxID=60889 RepID=A0AA40FE31_9HYME|nr:hypothetical protein K0M31_016699 [Melipona bicolor]